MGMVYNKSFVLDCTYAENTCLRMRSTRSCVHLKRTYRSASCMSSLIMRRVWTMVAPPENSFSFYPGNCSTRITDCLSTRPMTRTPSKSHRCQHLSTTNTSGQLPAVIVFVMVVYTV